MKNIFRNLLNILLIGILIYSGYNIYTKLSEYRYATSTYTQIRTEKKENLSSKNTNFKFWITVDNTNIDYPVVQSKDNEYYLSKDFYNQDSSSGSIFMDYRNKFDDKNIILYGHNMKNKTMFNNILKFKEENFFK
ncbi:MAG: sortase domain-containing protein, partial [Paraclostridium sp.]